MKKNLNITNSKNDIVTVKYYQGDEMTNHLVYLLNFISGSYGLPLFCVIIVLSSVPRRNVTRGRYTNYVI